VKMALRDVSEILQDSLGNDGKNSSFMEVENARKYDRFEGRTIVVDLATVDWSTEDFEGRDWLEWHTREQLPVGWDLEWQPDRKGQNNPIALMQFGDESTCLLLRTHRSRNWLPQAVMKNLLSEGCKKIGVGWDGADKLKMERTFKFQPFGIVDLAQIATEKGLREQGLKALCEHFGYHPRKDSRCARSNWACWHLTPEQVQYAAEDAHFTYLLYDKLLNLTVPAGPTMDVSTDGQLLIKDEWVVHGIVRKADGLWCSLCEKGPMTMPIVVERHIEGAKHKKALEQKASVYDENGAVRELPAKYVEAGIIAGDANNPKLKLGEYKCSLCDAGPFNTLSVVDVHLTSKKHLKAIAPKPDPAEVLAAQQSRDVFAEKLWNMPDYCREEGEGIKKVLVCSLCESKANAVAAMYAHLGGDKHARKTRSGNFPEVIYIKDRDRLEILATGEPVLRTGFKIPRNHQNPVSAAHAAASSSSTANPEAGIVDAKSRAASDANSSSDHGGRAKTFQSSLPKGWEEHVDRASGCLYYCNHALQLSQWEPPDASRESSPTLPPGWQMRWSESLARWYYADFEGQSSQWEPPCHDQHDWRRQLDPKGEAFWSCPVDAFYEGDAAWQRLQDHSGHAYWSNASKNLRFFESWNHQLAMVAG